MKKKTQLQRFTEYIEIRLSYRYNTEAQIAKKYHVSYSEISKALHDPRFNNIKRARLNKIKAPVITNKTLTTNNLDDYELKERPANNSSNNVAENNNVISYSDSQSAKSNLIKSKSTNSIREAPTETKSNVSNPTFNPVNNVSKASPVSSPTPNAIPAKNQPTSNLPTLSTTPKVPENTDNTKLSNWNLIKSYLKRKFENWLKNILDGIDLKIHHDYEDRP